MNRWILPALWLAINPALAVSIAPHPTDFAWGIPLRIDGRGSLYELELPESVYRGVVQGVDVDLRVFNGRGEVVPHALLLPRTVVREKRKPVPLYPLRLPRDAMERSRVRLHSDASGRGTVVAEPGAQKAPTEPAWIVDLEGVDQPVVELCLEWEKSSSGLERVQVEGSRDLEHWVSVSQGVLGALQQGPRRLEHHCLELEWNVSASRYLRLRGVRQPLSLQLTAAQAVWRGKEPATVMLFVVPQFLKADEEDGSGWQYRSPGRFPVVLARIGLPDDSLAEMRVASRSDEAAPWRERGHGLVYNLRSNGLRISQTDIDLQRSDDRLWRLQAENASLGQAWPQLMLGYRPHRLRFLARGPGPFILAYGSARVQHGDAGEGNLLGKLANGERRMMPLPALAGAVKKLGGEAVLRPPLHLAWGRWVLWAVLLLGVFVVALLVRSLYRDLTRSQD